MRQVQQDKNRPPKMSIEASYKGQAYFTVHRAKDGLSVDVSRDDVEFVLKRLSYGSDLLLRWARVFGKCCVVSLSCLIETIQDSSMKVECG